MPSEASEPISEFGRSTIVRAGAGAGKTTALTEHVLEVAKDFYKINKRYPRVVVTTFTKKATQELKERLVLLALKKERDLLEFVNSSSILKISTIHGILDQYLRQYGSFLELDPSFTVINSSMASQLARQVVRRILLTHPEKEKLQALIDDFSFRKLERLCREYYRVKLQYPEMSPYDAASLERLNQLHIASVADEVDELVRSIQAEESNPKWLTYAEHMQVLAHEMRHRNWTESFEFLKKIFEETPAATRTKNIQITDETNELKSEMTSRLKKLFSEEAYQPESFRQFAERFAQCKALFEAFAQEFFKLKLQMASVEINDLELFSLKLSREFAQTAKAFSDDWDYWLIDEYQDTSPVQVELIEVLSQAKPQYVVGDPQQSIYLFRGARSEVFQNRETEILSRDGVKLEKIKNYRSRPELLEFFNEFFSKLSIPFSPMIAHWPDGGTKSSVPVAKFYVAEVQEGNDDEEILAIVEHIESLIKKETKLEDICILSRTNKNLVEISKILNHFGLANHVHVSSGFYHRREIQDALALYKFLIHPHNNLNLLVLLRSPWFLVDDQFLIDQLLNGADSYWVHLIKHKNQHPGLKRLADALERSNEIGMSQSFLEALIENGLFDFSKQADHSGRVESNIWKLVSLFREQEQKAGFNPLDLIAQIESDMRADQDGEGDAITAIEPERINLMTIHASKGLQFRHVLVVRMDKRPKSPLEPDFLFDEEEKKWSIKIPLGEDEKFTGSIAEKNYVQKMKKSEIAEHARVLYVAMTRAIDSVFLSWTLPVEGNSWADMIRWDLTPGVHPREHYSYEVLSGAPQPKVLQSLAPVALPVRAPFHSEGDGKKSKLSVTSLIDGVNPAGARGDWLEVFKVVSNGSLTHKLMQAMKYATNVEALVSRWFPSRELEVLKALSYMQKLEAPPLASLIDMGHVEMGFSYREDDKIIDGQIDLWGIVDDEVWIVDYKTGSTKYKDKAFLQLEYYAKALQKSDMIRSEQTIWLSVIYPFGEKVFNKKFD